MKKVRIKLIISILLMIGIILISQISMAVITIDGNTYLTNGDLGFEDGQIIVKPTGKKYYCTNHNARLGNDMVDAPSLTKTMNTTITQKAGGPGPITSDATMRYIMSLQIDPAVNALITSVADELRGNNQTARISYVTDWTPARDPLEAAIYAFSKEFNVYVHSTKEAIWNYEYMHENSKEAPGDYLELWEAAKAYVQWAGYDEVTKDSYKDYKENEGIFNTNGEQEVIKENGTKDKIKEDPKRPNLTFVSGQEQMNFDYEDSCYRGGPYTISYNEGSKYGDIQFTKDLSIDITKINLDGTTGEISDYKVTDAIGNKLTKIPIGDAFYLEIPYEGNEILTELKIDTNLKYISEIQGQSKTHKIIVQEWYYTLSNWNTYYETFHQHASNCGRHPGEQYTITGNLSYMGCCDWAHRINGSSGYAEYRVKATGTAKLNYREAPQLNTMQDMREIDGSVKWDTATATISVQVQQADMIIAGDVWEDAKVGKDLKFNGSLDTNDSMLEGIEVRLYEIDGTLAKLEPVVDENGKLTNTNPTITDENGHYEFSKVPSIKKYYVQFTYDGMIYTNTYGAGKPEYNTPDWNATSKGSELINERDSFNTKFVTIGSYPKGYKPQSVLFNDMTYLIDGYNEVFNINDSGVLDYKLKIKEQLKIYFSTNNRLEDGQQNYVDAIYKPILNSIRDNNEKIKARRILQYIWDCRINSYGGYESVKGGKTDKISEKYPYYDRFIVADKDGNPFIADEEKNLNGYWYIYNGQLHINQGIIRREFTDLELTEDLYKTVISINGKDEVYKYGSLSKKEVNVSSADLMSYTQNISKSDYNYKKESSELSSTAEYAEGYAPIQLYVTYKVKVTNTSMIPTSVREVATYFNPKYYSYSDSYVTTEGKTLVGLEGKFVANNEEKNLSDYDSDNFGMKTNTTSIYGESSETGKELGADLYIAFDKDIILNNQEGLALYLTYRLGENSTKDAKYNCTYNESNRGNSAQVILQDVLVDENSEFKIGTQSEINSFATYHMKTSEDRDIQNKYADHYKYTSAIRAYDTYRAAGVLDSDSMPGNLDSETIQTAHDNLSKAIEQRKELEDDWDDATTLVIKQADVRKLLGNVWEVVGKDESHWARTEEYPQYDAEHKVEDITVELIEIKDGKEYVRATTLTNESGQYLFEGFIPGEYVVRFIYGDRALNSNSTIQTNGSDIRCPYNGLFYQSTKSNPKTNANQFWYVNEEGVRYSDAYDEVTVRTTINNNSATQEYTYKDIVNILSNPTDYLVHAYTSMLDIYPEKGKTETTAAQNPGYEISNIDFGLTPRSLNDLQIKKEVTHLKLILQNGMVQFDADTATIREQGVPAVVQAAQGHDINVSMSSELVNGATLEITYSITVTNNTPKEQITYYKDGSDNNIAVALYNEEAEKLVYYEDAIRVHKSENTDLVQIASSQKQLVTSESRAMVIADFIPNNLNFIKNDYTGRAVNDMWDVYSGTKQDLEEDYYKHELEADNPLGIVNMEATEVYNSNSIVLANDNNPLIKTNLKPGESVSGEIVLSKVISVNNDSADTKSYNNRVKILKIYSSNSRLQDMVGAESEKVIISDPTGINSRYMIIALTLVVFVIIGLGIVLIKKFVISRK